MDVLLDVLCGASMNLYDNSLVAYGNLRGPPPNNANIPQEIAGLIRGIPLNKAGLIFLGVKPSWHCGGWALGFLGDLGLMQSWQIEGVRCWNHQALQM